MQLERNKTESNMSIRVCLQDVWDMLWSEDSPDLFAMMEKGRMYIFRCAAWQSSWLLSFNDLCLCVGSSVHDHASGFAACSPSCQEISPVRCIDSCTYVHKGVNEG